MRRSLLLVAAASAAAVIAFNSPAGRAVPLPNGNAVFTGVFDDPEWECFEFAPVAAHVPGVDGDGPISLDIALVADRLVTTDRALQIVAKAQQAYTPLNITLNIHSVQHVDFVNTDILALMEELRAHFGGVRPAGADIVAAITSTDTTLNVPGAGPNPGVAGFANCLGGVRFAERAFLVAEDETFTYEGLDDTHGYQIGPVNFYGNLAAKTFAHEAGHLLGAQHHYANCAEGVPTEIGEVSPCTLMTNFADFISINFGTVESSIVRGHAELYAAP